MVVSWKKNITRILTAVLAAACCSLAALPNRLEPRRIPESTNSVSICRKGNYLYASGWRGLSVYNLKNPLEPRLIQRIPGISGRQMAVQDDILYITARMNGLWILDISEPADPKVLTRFDTVELATGIAVVGKIVFVAQRIYGVEILDCSNTEKPRHIGLIRGGEIQSVAYQNKRLYGGSWGDGNVYIWDVADVGHPKMTGRIPLDGYGDGIALSGNLCYAATRKDARTGAKEKRKNHGHGLEIFNLSDPAKPIRIGSIKFPPSPTIFFDSWTVTLSGSTAYVTDTVNGFFLVDIADPAKPEVLAWGRLPDWNGKPNPVGSLAIGDGVLYIAGMDGVYTVIWKHAEPPQTRKEPVPAESKGPAYELPGFQRYDVSGQVRRLFLDGDLLYAACSHQGILTFRVTEKDLRPLRRYPVECSYDIAVRDGKIYSAEGNKGLAVYRIDPSGGLVTLAREKDPCLHLRLVSNPRFLLCSAGGMELFIKNISDPAVIRTVFRRRVRGIFYTDTTADRDIHGILPVNCHGGGVLWLDLNQEIPSVILNSPSVIARQDSAPCALGSKFLFPSSIKKGYLLLDPCHPNRGTDQVFKIPGFQNPSGTAASDGSRVVFTSRHAGTITTVDFSDPEHPGKIPSRSFSNLPGSPGRAVFAHGRILIPAGHYGILYEEPDALNPTQNKNNVSKDISRSRPSRILSHGDFRKGSISPRKASDARRANRFRDERHGTESGKGRVILPGPDGHSASLMQDAAKAIRTENNLKTFLQTEFHNQ